MSAQLRLMPCAVKEAIRFVARHHRHNKPPPGGLFAVAVACGEIMIGVAIVGRPVARLLDDGRTCEATRVCTDGSANACSMLYGAVARAAKALGYARIVTYVLASEPGTSLRAAGWTKDKEVRLQQWSRSQRTRVDVDLFGEHQKPQEDKVRWQRQLAE